MSLRIGTGIDFHQLVTGRELWIGGVKIPHSKGGLGHSDADVLLHAICDALLGAACLGDIGLHFPDTSSTFKDIDSRILLKSTNELVGKAGFKIINIDSTICLQEPKIISYIIKMRQEIAGILSIPQDAVSIKATTTEKMGFVGRGEGMSAYACVLLDTA
jgi:2-C-methyl-D-erythritol 2,4-cyclodiphosphate synthase